MEKKLRNGGGGRVLRLSKLSFSDFLLLIINNNNKNKLKEKKNKRRGGA
jgi:hypothetical protein